MAVKKPTTAIKAIRAFCVQCTAGDLEAIRNCKPLPDTDACPLWPYRMGKNPNISAETRAKASKRWQDKKNAVKSAENIT